MDAKATEKGPTKPHGNSLHAQREDLMEKNDTTHSNAHDLSNKVLFLFPVSRMAIRCEQTKGHPV
jgi:hypothetical protein